MTTPEVEKRALKYCRQRNLTLDSCLGVGTQASVFACKIPSLSGKIANQIAVKFHDREVDYHRELAVFLRLRDLDRPPDYTPEVWADWKTMKADGLEDNWPTVENIPNEFKTYEIFIADDNRGNIKFS